MTRAAIFLSVAVIAASVGVGANSAVAMGQENASTENTNNSSQRTVVITGCLHSTGPGVYTISDGEGTTYTLAGNTDTLQGHNEQEVKVTGQQAFSGPSTTSPASSNSTATIQVSAADVVADHCSSSSSPQAQTSGSASAAASPRASAATAGGQARVLNSAQEAQNATGDPPQLPQTSTILPLLGLIGLGSLVAGLFARK
jgi:hypothetical protein